jgi:catechol 2,3-dioxygenase-like lactoylglutathione lyase family enzyme
MTPQSTVPNPRSHFLGHISLGIRSYTISKLYYTALFAPFGISLVYSNETSSPKTLGFGPSTSPEYELFTLFEKGLEAQPPGPGTHVAFNAPSRKAVREFWEAGVRNGGRDEGAPGVRREVGARYYAAFVRDPDGYKLEAVFQGEDDDV